MAIPFRRTSKTRKAKRRTHQKINQPTIVTCDNCGTKIAPHSVCPGCGYYKGKQVIKVKDEK